jgi:hypothetical protein
LGIETLELVESIENPNKQKDEDQDAIEAAQALCARSRNPNHILPVSFSVPFRCSSFLLLDH